MTSDWPTSCSQAEEAIATLIDFDFSAELKEERFYPPGFNLDIGDGKRHPGAAANKRVELAHDVFSAGTVLELFQVHVEPQDHDGEQKVDESLPQVVQLLKGVLDHESSSRLEQAITMLSELNLNAEIKLKSEVFF